MPSLTSQGRKKTVPGRVFEYLVDYIRDNHVEPGDLLPGELELSARLEASRSSVREAIAFLKTFDICRSQSSVGLILVADRRKLDLLKLFSRQELNEDDFRKLKQLRDFLELGSCHLMVRNATPKEIGQLQTLIRLVADRRIEVIDFEVEFHLVLAHLSGNPFAVALGLQYRPIFEYHVRHHPLLRKNAPMPKYIIDSHRKMLEAIETGDETALYRELRRQAAHTE